MYLKGKEYFDVQSPDKEEVLKQYPDEQDQIVCVDRQGTVL